MKRAKSVSVLLQALEGRVLLSGAPQVMGYLVDYKVGNSGSAIFSEDGSGNVVNNALNWGKLNQVNYFALLPDATPKFVSTGATPTGAGRSDGGLQSLSDSGFDPSKQVPAIVTHAQGDKVFVTVGGGDANAIYDMDALVNTPGVFGTFAKNIENFCKSFGLAGVDLDWEPTGQDGFNVTKAQIENFGNLIATMKSTFATDHANLQISAGTLGDASELFDSNGNDLNMAAFTLDAKAIANLDAVNVEAYPGETEAQSNNNMMAWASYVTTGSDLDGNKINSVTSKLWYGIDIVPGDDASNNPAGVIENKVDLAVSQGFGGMFVWELEADAGGSALSRIAAEIAKDTTTSNAGGTVSGTVKDTHGTGIGGITVYLDANNNLTLDAGEMHTVTAANGTYSFTKVPPLFYIVRQQLPATEKQVTPSNNTGDHVTVSNGSVITGQNFTDTPVAVITGGSVSGTVKNTQGVGIGNITVYLDANNNVKLDGGEMHTVTASNGTYSFANVPAGFYIVRQQLPANEKQITPNNNTGDHVTVSNGSKITGQNFTDSAVVVAVGGSVSGTVKDSHGAGIGGVTVYLDANNNSILDAGEKSTVTAADGTYTISGIAAGAYIVRQKLPATIKQVTPGNNFGDHVMVTSTSKITGQNFTDNVTVTPPPPPPPPLAGKVIGASVSLNSAKSGHAASNAFDGKTSTTFEDTVANGNWIGLDLGKEFKITQIEFAADPTNPSFMEGGIFQASNSADFSSGVVNLFQVPNTSTPSTSLTAENISNSSGFRYVRYLPPAGSFGDVAEVEFFGTADA